MAALAFAAALLSAAPGASQEGLPARDDVRQAAREILSSREYDIADPGFNVLRWVLNKITEFFSSLSALHSSSPAFYWMIFLVCLVVLALIFTHAGVVVLRALRAARAKAPAEGEGSVRRDEDPTALLANAGGLADAGDFREAIRLCHRAALFGLDRAGALRYRESLTTGDYLLQLRARPRERSGFDALAQIYEPAFFGRAAVSRPDYDASRRRVAELLETPRP